MYKSTQNIAHLKDNILNSYSFRRESVSTKENVHKGGAYNMWDILVAQLPYIPSEVLAGFTAAKWHRVD